MLESPQGELKGKPAADLKKPASLNSPRAGGSRCGGPEPEFEFDHAVLYEAGDFAESLLAGRHMSNAVRVELKEHMGDVAAQVLRKFAEGHIKEQSRPPSSSPADPTSSPGSPPQSKIESAPSNQVHEDMAATKKFKKSKKKKKSKKTDSLTENPAPLSPKVDQPIIDALAGDSNAQADFVSAQKSEQTRIEQLIEQNRLLMEKKRQVAKELEDLEQARLAQYRALRKSPVPATPVPSTSPVAPKVSPVPETFLPSKSPPQSTVEPATWHQVREDLATINEENKANESTRVPISLPPIEPRTRSWEDAADAFHSYQFVDSRAPVDFTSPGIGQSVEQTFIDQLTMRNRTLAMRKARPTKRLKTGGMEQLTGENRRLAADVEFMERAEPGDQRALQIAQRIVSTAKQDTQISPAADPASSPPVSPAQPKVEPCEDPAATKESDKADSATQVPMSSLQSMKGLIDAVAFSTLTDDKGAPIDASVLDSALEAKQKEIDRLIEQNRLAKEANAVSKAAEGEDSDTEILALTKSEGRRASESEQTYVERLEERNRLLAEASKGLASHCETIEQPKPANRRARRNVQKLAAKAERKGG